MKTLRTLPVAFAFAVVALPAAADEATEAFLKSWVQSIDSAPGWNAAYTGITSDASGATTLSGLNVTTEKPGFALTVDTIGVLGHNAGANASFAAEEVTIDGAKAETEFVTLRLNGGVLEGFSLPPASAFMWDETKPYLSLVSMFRAFSEISMASGMVASFVVDQRYEDEPSTTTYANVTLSNWADGKIASIKAGPIDAETPSGETLLAMRIASAESSDIDLGALVRVLDPATYAGGKGDMVWHTALGRTTYSDMLVAVPGVSVRIAEIFNEDFRVRQPEGGIDAFLELGLPGNEDKFDDPKEAVRLVGALRAFGIGRAGVRDVEVEAEGIERARLAGFTLADFSLDKLGELSFDGIDVAIPGQGTVAVGRVALGELAFPPIEAVVAAAAAEESGEDVDVSAVMPKLGFFEAAAINVAIPEVISAALESMRLDLGRYIGPVPTTVALSVVDADLPIDAIEEESARQVLEALGYERVRIDAGLNIDWSEAGELTIGEYRVGIRDAGVISGDARLSGIAPADYEELEDPSVLASLLFHGGSLSVLDQSIVARGVALQAGMTGTNPDEFRQTFVMGLPYMLTFLGSPNLIQQVVPILQSFISTNGGSVTATFSPAQPVPFTELATAAEADPVALIELLGTKFSGEAGEAPAPGADAPASDAPATDAPAAPADEPSKQNSAE